MIYDLLELAAELLAGTLCASIVVGGTLPLMVAGPRGHELGGQPLSQSAVPLPWPRGAERWRRASSSSVRVA